MQNTTKLGGFPPIFLVTTEFKKESESNKNREFSSLSEKTVNIKDILNIKIKKNNEEKSIFDIK
jgi:hypothetical protein